MEYNYLNQKFVVREEGIVDIILNVSKIETNRLVLRAFNENDLNDLYEYASVEGVGEMAGWPRHESINTSKAVLESFIKDNNVLAIVYKENGKVIGSVGIMESWANNEDCYKELKVKEIGYALSKEYWGKGIMPEAVNAVIKFFFEKHGFDALTCGHFSFNNQSKRVIEKCGFTFVKQSQYYSKQLDKTFDDSKYILLNNNARQK